LLARQRGAASTCEQLKAVAEPFCNLLRCEELHARSRQLDRQRDAIQLLADLGYIRGVVSCQCKSRIRFLCTLGKEPRRFVAHKLPGVSQVFEILRQRQRWHTIDCLSIDSQRLPARRDDFQFGAGMQKMVREPGTGLDEVLAVIQHEQHLFAAQIIGEGVDQRDALGFAQMEDGGNGREDVGRVGQRRELDEPDPVFERRNLLCRKLQAEPGLPRPARTDKRQQARRG
jgi:hypothetical protein